jgi:hypothetical protein
VGEQFSIKVPEIQKGDKIPEGEKDLLTLKKFCCCFFLKISI